MSDENRPEEGKINYYPFDYAALTKGQYISPEECERLTGMKRSQRMYSLKVQDLVDGIHHERDRMGMPVVAKIQNDGISVLTDEEAVVYTRQRFKAGMRLAGRSHSRSVVAIDVTQLSENAKRVHERNVDVQARMLISAMTEKARIELLPYKRNTPGLPSSKLKS